MIAVKAPKVPAAVTDRHGHLRNPGVGLRARAAFHALQERKAGYTRANLAAEVAQRSGRKTPYNYSAAVRWLQGVMPDSLAAMVAIADTLGVNPNWLFWGRGYRYPRREDLEELEPVPTGGGRFEVPVPTTTRRP